MDRRATLRKRKREQEDGKVGGILKLLAAAKECERVVIFSGSGLSATSGMSTFSTKGGLYERAQRRFGISEGKKLFTYSFFEKRKLDAQAFFADIYAEAKKAEPAAGHKAIAALAASGKLQRHYTLNVDGLAEHVGLSTWHPTTNPLGSTVEIHGSIKQMVCPDCSEVVVMSDTLLRKLKAKKHVPCSSCACASIRCRIMLYDDAQDECITPDDVFDVMEEDVQTADLIMWVGISFEQSASTAYFRRVRSFLCSAGRLADCCQAVVNLSEEAHWNLLSSCSNTGDLDVLEVLGSSDDVLPLVAAAASGQPSVLPSQPAPQPPSPAPERRGRRSRASTRTPEASVSREPSQARGAGSPVTSQPRCRSLTPHTATAPSSHPQAFEASIADESTSTAAPAEILPGAGAIASPSLAGSEGVKPAVAACGPAAREQRADHCEANGEAAAYRHVENALEFKKDRVEVGACRLVVEASVVKEVEGPGTIALAPGGSEGEMQTWTPGGEVRPSDDSPHDKIHDICEAAVRGAPYARVQSVETEGSQHAEKEGAQTAEKEGVEDVEKGDMKVEVALMGGKASTAPKSVGLVASAMGSPVLAAQAVVPFLLLPDVRAGPEAEE